ncbi:MAG: YcxB family protein [Rhizomicrobium sp.]
MPSLSFTAKLDDADLRDIRNITRTTTSWLKLALTNAHAVLFLVLAVWATVAAPLDRIHPDWGIIGVVWAAAITVDLGSIYSSRRARPRALMRLNKTRVEKISFDGSGISWSAADGASGFLPWQNFKGWREGKRVMVVDQTQGNRPLFLPIADLSESDRISLRHFLHSSIRPAPTG